MRGTVDPAAGETKRIALESDYFKRNETIVPKPQARIELATSSLPRTRYTAKPLRRCCIIKLEVQ